MEINCYTWHAPSKDEDQMQLEDGMHIKREGHNKKHMLWGDIVQVMNHRISITNTPESGATLIFIETRAGIQSHDLDPSPHFWETNTWIGADGVPPLYHQGEWRDPKKKQLFRLHEGQSILFIDAFKEVTKLTAQACGEKPQRERASEGEVADYILEEAFKRGENPHTRSWCFHSLQELGCQAQLDKFHGMFPNFRRT